MGRRYYKLATNEVNKVIQTIFMFSLFNNNEKIFQDFVIENGKVFKKLAVIYNINENRIKKHKKLISKIVNNTKGEK